MSNPDFTSSETSSSRFSDEPLAPKDEAESQRGVHAEDQWAADDDETNAAFQPAGSDQELVDLQQPFIGRWNELISTTNWEKGRIISQWRAALIDAGAPITDYSDESWASRVGGVTAPHVGRLRRVWDRFGDQYESYRSLYWSHFLAALDWDDAALWLQGAVEENWSVSGMREQRWQANGAQASDRPSASQIVEVELDEGVPDLGTAPAQGASPRDFDGETDGVASGPIYEPPDFGEDAAANLGEMRDSENDAPPADNSPVQPFANLPALPDDLSDVIEALKLAILRHKTAGYEEVEAETLRKYLQAVATLIQ